MLDILRRSVARRRLLRRSDRLTTGRDCHIFDTRFEGVNAVADGCVVQHSSVGRYTYFGPRCIVASAQVGRFCSIAPEVIIGSGSHPVRTSIALHPVFYLARSQQGWSFVDHDRFDDFAPTRIGNDVWLGARSLIRDGVTVGDGVVVGGGAVVVSDLEPYGIYGGVPARLIRFRFPESVIADLLAFRWWEKDEAWLRDHADAFGDPDGFARMIRSEAGVPDPLDNDRGPPTGGSGSTGQG